MWGGIRRWQSPPAGETTSEVLPEKCSQPCGLLNLLLTVELRGCHGFQFGVREQLLSGALRFSFSNLSKQNAFCIQEDKGGGLLINFGSSCQGKHCVSPVLTPRTHVGLQQCCGLRIPTRWKLCMVQLGHLLLLLLQ